MRAKILKFRENMQYSINARHARNVNSISDHLPEEIRVYARVRSTDRFTDHGKTVPPYPSNG